MSEEVRYKTINRDYWDARVEHHIDSEFYDQNSFLKGRNSLNTYEVDLLGDLTGKKLAHFQCHFGQDTLSMARLGASCVGVDLSPEAVSKANGLAKLLEIDAHFVCADVLEANQYLDQDFDIVFTSYGTIGWLPDLDRWAKQISSVLKSGGHFIMVDFHPVVHMLDDETMSSLHHSYFNKGLISGTEFGSYADGAEELENDFHTWNHSMSELWNALSKNGLQWERFEEFEHSPYPCFPNMEASSKGYQFKGLEGKIPMLYGIRAVKK